MPVPAFQETARSFTQNLQAVRVFSQEIGKFAAEYDRKALDQFGVILREVSPELAELMDDSSFLEGAPGADAAAKEEDEKTKRIAGNPPKEIHIHLDSREKAKAFVAAAKNVNRAAPVQREILRQGTLITLMSYLEALVADLIHAFYTKYPAAMPADERTLTLAELREIGSVEDAETILLAKEVDSVLRESLGAQLDYFAKRPKIDVSPLQKHRDGLVEVDQRRNLYVHNRGIVNRTYLKRVKPSIARDLGAREGKRVETTDEYLLNAIDLVEICGTILLQQCWRKWVKDEQGVADNLLIEVLFEALQAERYSVVEHVAEYARSIDFEYDSTRRIVLINHAIALRDLGRMQEMEALVNTLDWSASSLLFQVALHALRGEDEAFYRLLPKAVAAEEISQDDLESWPLFKRLRDSPKFAAAVQEHFPDSTTAELNTVPTPPNAASGEES